MRAKALLLLTLLVCTPAFARGRWTAEERLDMAARVRAAILDSWGAYKKHAWTHDELKPVSNTAHDWHAQPLLMTPVDTLDTLLLIGAKSEADEARELIATTLSFDRDISVKNFEITIRILGGLLSAYELTGDERLLYLADEDESGGDRHAVPRVRHARAPHAEARVLRQGEARAGGAVQPPLEARPRRRGDRRRDGPVGVAREPRRRRDRFVLRIPAQRLAAVRG
jgi:hypothetical protein